MYQMLRLLYGHRVSTRRDHVGSWFHRFPCARTVSQDEFPLTVSADVSVKNPNSISFKFNEATTNLFYDDVVVGEALTPPGTVNAQRTLRINMSVGLQWRKF
ncbi:hypothetical protein HAX54_000653 [Datura stramonium]|uniref:Late embryogenesis abundant protein LEA-2 subgroup domain-containing protein n=1 Tax=Datura stramonium TaxID=4076 RepID=A0ABS8RSC8_DATST|nr:hypothetical protein [Datura stramonium]